MTKHWAKLCFISAVLVFTAQAAHEAGKSPALSGSIETGVGYGGIPADTAGITGTAAASGMQWWVDSVHLKHNFDVSDKTKVVVHNALALGTNNNVPTKGQNGVNYFGNALLTGGGTSNFVAANLGAYLQHKCTDNLYTSIGNLPTPFGMESMSSRYDMATYYYSNSISRAYQAGWMYDLGVNLHLADTVAGSLEFSILDGRQARGANSNFVNTDPTNTFTPAIAARYSYTFKAGEMSIIPVVSTYLGKWRGGPSDLGVTAGVGFKMGAFWANGEFLYTSGKATVASTVKDTQWSAVVEPGFDFGAAEVSAKWEYYNNTVGDSSASPTGNGNMNLGLAVAKTWAENYKVKLAFPARQLQPQGAYRFGGSSWRKQYARPVERRSSVVFNEVLIKSKYGKGRRVILPPFLFWCHCEERSDVAIHAQRMVHRLLRRCAPRNDILIR